MTSPRTTAIRLGSALTVLALALVACGQGDSGVAAIPVNDDPGATPPAAAGACLVDEPDCDDLGQLPAGEDLPPSLEPGTSSGMVVDGGISVSEAVVGDYGGVVAVRGFLLDDGSGWRLCDALAESFPPQCGGDSLAITGHEELVDVPFLTEQGVTWTDMTVTVLGEIVGGTLVVDPAVSG